MLTMTTSHFSQKQPPLKTPMWEISDTFDTQVGLKGRSLGRDFVCSPTHFRNELAFSRFIDSYALLLRS
jgi:hypothetical protein